MPDTLPAFIEIICIAYFGLILGSFATAIAHREANGESWFSLRGSKSEAWSKCPQCGHRLGLADLIPVVSWVLSRGQCRYCSKPVPARYPVIEIMCMIGCLGLYAAYDFEFDLVPLLFLVPFLVALFWVDVDVMILPDRLVAICGGIAAFFVLYVFLESGNTRFLADSLLGMAAYPAVFGAAAFIMTKILKKSALGMGDIKFLAPAGLLAGLDILSAYLVLAGILGVLTAIPIRKYKDSVIFPFGPSLIFSLYIIIIYKGFYLQ